MLVTFVTYVTKVGKASLHARGGYYNILNAAKRRQASAEYCSSVLLLPLPPASFRLPPHSRFGSRRMPPRTVDDFTTGRGPGGRHS